MVSTRTSTGDALGLAQGVKLAFHFATPNSAERGWLVECRDGSLRY